MNVTPHRIAVLQLLLGAKANVNDGGDGGYVLFPLDIAATPEVARMLRAHGARAASGNLLPEAQTADIGGFLPPNLSIFVKVVQ